MAKKERQRDSDRGGAAGNENDSPPGSKDTSRKPNLRQLVGKLLRSAGGRGQASTRTSLPRATVETLEPRLLLSTAPLPQPTFSGTLNYTATPGTALHATLEVVDTGAATPFLEMDSGST